MAWEAAYHEEPYLHIAHLLTSLEVEVECGLEDNARWSFLEAIDESSTGSTGFIALRFLPAYLILLSASILSAVAGFRFLVYI